jgi:uncharacterized oligopeptide transporter (OPT) family protein
MVMAYFLFWFGIGIICVLDAVVVVGSMGALLTSAIKQKCFKDFLAFTIFLLLLIETAATLIEELNISLK